MRVIDKESPNDAEKFWVQAGKMSVQAMLSDRPLSDFIIEDKPEVIEAATELPKDVRNRWFQAAIKVTLKQMLKADAQQQLKNPDSPSIAFAPLLKYLDFLSKFDSKFAISARAVQPKKATRKIVSHDKNGRIASFLEVEEEVVV